MKKVKLFTTIASLCLAVALMAFGVYAATAINTVNVSGSINFASTTKDGYFSKVVITPTDCTITGKPDKTGDNTEAGELKEWKDIAINVDSGKTTAYFVITATYVNVGSTQNIDVKALAGTPASETTYTIAYSDATTAVAYGTKNVGEGKTSEVTVSIKVTFTSHDTAQSVDAAAWNVSFTAE